jgi:hypothetical protein
MERAVLVIGFGTVVREVSRPELEVIRRETKCAGISERVILRAGEDGVGEEEIMEFCGEAR